MNREEALIYIWDLLDEYYGQSKDDETGILLGDIDPNPIRLGVPETTADPAGWGDWISVVNQISKSENLSENESKKAIIALMEECNAHHGFRLDNAIHHVKSLLAD